MSNNVLSTSNITLPKVYEDLVNEDIREVILSSGRISGKTSALVVAWWIYHNRYPDNDIVILQATASEIRDSIINEIKKFLSNSGLIDEYDIPESSRTIKKKGMQGSTYFYPITDHTGGQRTRGVATPNKICLLMFEETQKNKDRNVVEQALATFTRQLMPRAKKIMVGNSETIGHWFIEYVREKVDSGWKYIYANCYDIWGLLNEETKKMITALKENNPVEFRRMYLGDIYASANDVVFPQFDRSKHYLARNQLEEKYIVSVIFGVDHATANDTFAVVPVAILDDGTTQTLEVMYSDPKEINTTLAPTEQCELLDEFLHFIDERYGLVYNQVPVYISIDGAASTFIEQLKHTKKTSQYRKLWSKIDIKRFTKKKKDVNMGIIKNAFAYGVLTILNEGTAMWDGRQNKHRLRHEIESQRYKGLTRKLDPAIANDLVDALEYGLIPYYVNVYNISFPVRKQNDKSKRKEIASIAKK